MSTQENKLTAIANAIREKDGTTEPIPANDFAARIRAMQGGGITLESISITAPPNKVRYCPGDLFDPTGMVVAAAYSNGAGLIATGWAVEPAGPLPEGLEAVTVRYTEGGVSATASQPVEVRPREYFYGYDINLADSNPATRVSYPIDVDNAAFAKAAMNFSTDKFNYGGWPSAPGSKFMPRPCMLNFDGTVAYYLNPNDYTKKADGTASDVANINFEGNAMMEWPKIYTKRWETDGVYHFRCSDVPLDGEYQCWSNYDREDNEIPYFYTSIFEGVMDSVHRIRSISNGNSAAVNTIQDEIDRSTANGADWYIEVVADVFLIRDLLTMMFKSTDLQNAVGNGNVGGGNLVAPGSMNGKGMFWGSNNKSSGIKVFGMENFWGNYWRRIAGWIYKNDTQLVKITRGTKDGSTANDYNTTGDGYLPIEDSSIGNGYISGMKTMPYGRIPVAPNGSSTTYEADYLLFSAGSGPFYAVKGCANRSNMEAGPFASGLHVAPSYTATFVGLSCKPLASVQAQT